MNKSNWFCIEPYVHIAVKRGKALLYNTLNGKILEETDPGVVALVEKLDSKENLLVVPMGPGELADPTIADFVERVRQDFFGDLIDCDYSEGRPLQMRPQAKVQKDIEEENAGGSSILGEGIMEHLTELNLYVNNACPHNCSFCDGAYKQFLHCTASGTDRELSTDDIARLVNDATGSAVHKVNVLGGDIFTHSKFQALIDCLNDFPRPKTYHTYYKSLPGRGAQLEGLNHESSNLQVTVDFPLDEKAFQDAHTELKGAGLTDGTDFLFIIQRVEDVEAAQTLASRYNIGAFTFKPLYNGTNFDFFKDNIFIDKEGLSQSKSSLKQILSRMKLNPLNFGKLTILSDNSFHANVNEAAVGTLGRESVHDAVLEEMKEGTSWRRSRDKVQPCDSCVYCFVCPPLTNFEYALGQNNLCHIWSE